MATAKKYHISPETGRPNQCTATVRGCKYAVDGQMPEHYESKEAARKAYENQNDDKTVQSVSKKDTKLSSRKLSVEEINKSEEAQKHYSVSARAQIRLDGAEKDLKESETYRSSLLKREEELDTWGVSRTVERINATLNNYDSDDSKLEIRDYEIRTPNTNEDGAVKSYSVTYDKDKLREELNKRKISAQNKITENAHAVSFFKKAVKNTKDNLVKQYGYSENPRYGVPTGENVVDKWKAENKQARNYSSAPTKNVPVLKDAQKYCTKCNEGLVKDESSRIGVSYQHASGDYKCANGQTFKTESITCKYCGTSDSKMVSFSQKSWSDETSCKRCGGVEGYAIGD